MFDSRLLSRTDNVKWPAIHKSDFDAIQVWLPQVTLCRTQDRAIIKVQFANFGIREATPVCPELCRAVQYACLTVAPVLYPARQMPGSRKPCQL
ncbi:MAG: hypothetical protein AAGE38_13610, partial [Pseudomonadota bacterium]